MMHRSRVWGVAEVSAEDLPDLARKLSKEGPTWTSCTGWRVGSYLLLNDQTSEDGAGEWGACKDLGDGGDLRQVESITLGWCSPEEAEGYLRKLLAGEYDAAAYARVPRAQVEEGGRHRSCPLCA